MPSDHELTLFYAARSRPPAGRNINYFKDDGADPDPVRLRSDDQSRRAEASGSARPGDVAEAVPEIPLYNVTRFDAVPAGLQRFKGNPTNTGIFWNVHEWELK
jgi:hypothetical protein